MANRFLIFLHFPGCPPKNLMVSPLSFVGQDDELRNVGLKTTRDTSHEMSYSCRVCGIWCDNRVNLSVHERTHTGELPYTCDICDKKFSQKGTMNRHKKAVHLREKPYKCEVCQRQFSVNSNLKAHMYTHYKSFQGSR